MFTLFALERKLADKVAAAGFFVVLPDFFYGDPFNLDNPQFDRESWLKAHSRVSLFLDRNRYNLCKWQL